MTLVKTDNWDELLELAGSNNVVHIGYWNGEPAYVASHSIGDPDATIVVYTKK